MTVEEIIAGLKKHYNPRNLEGMSRYGINVEKAFGVNVPVLRALAKKIGTDHELALKLWESGYHEARHIATMIDDPNLVTKAQMNK